MSLAAWAAFPCPLLRASSTYASLNFCSACRYDGMSEKFEAMQKRH